MSMTIANYQIKERLYESRNSLVYRVQIETENQPVILKMLKQAYPSPKKIAAFKREYEITQSLQLEGVVHAYDFAIDHHRPVIVLEDFGGESLAHSLQTTRFSLNDLFPLALKIADPRGQVHDQQVMHKDVNPAN